MTPEASDIWKARALQAEATLEVERVEILRLRAALTAARKAINDERW